MRKIHLAAAILVLTGVAVVGWGDVSVTSMVTLKDAQTDFTKANYAECVKKIASLMGTALTPAERASLLLMKAECLLQQKQGALSSEAFTAASSAFVAAKDVKGAAAAKATSGLIKASQDFSYIPKAGADRTALSIIDPVKRPAAMTAYFNDQLASAQESFKALKANVVLPEVQLFAPKLQELDALEMTATGDDKQTVVMEKGLATVAKTAIGTFITTSSKKTDTIAADAATMVKVPVANSGAAQTMGPGGRIRNNPQQQQQPTQKQEKGLTDADRTMLNNIATDNGKIPLTARNLQTSLGVDVDYFKAEVTNSAALKTKIEAILGGNFKPGG